MTIPVAVVPLVAFLSMISVWRLPLRMGGWSGDAAREHIQKRASVEGPWSAADIRFENGSASEGVGSSCVYQFATRVDEIRAWTRDNFSGPYHHASSV